MIFKVFPSMEGSNRSPCFHCNCSTSSEESTMTYLEYSFPLLLLDLCFCSFVLGYPTTLALLQYLTFGYQRSLLCWGRNTLGTKLLIGYLLGTKGFLSWASLYKKESTAPFTDANTSRNATKSLGNAGKAETATAANTEKEPAKNKRRIKHRAKHGLFRLPSAAA